MTKLPKYKLYRKAWIKWGAFSQLDMVMEECAELIQAVSKFKRCNTRREAAMREVHLLEEAADVQIMIEQLRTLYDDEVFKRIKKEKLERLEEMILSKK